MSVPTPEKCPPHRAEQKEVPPPTSLPESRLATPPPRTTGQAPVAAAAAKAVSEEEEEKEEERKAGEVRPQRFSEMGRTKGGSELCESCAVWASYALLAVLFPVSLCFCFVIFQVKTIISHALLTHTHGHGVRRKGGEGLLLKSIFEDNLPWRPIIYRPLNAKKCVILKAQNFLKMRKKLHLAKH